MGQEIKGSRLPKWRRRLAIAAVSLLVAFATAEIAARLSEPGPFDLFDRNPYESDPKLPHKHQPGFVGRWDGTWYEIDSRGLRGTERQPTFAANEFRVLALGDSCTFGKGVLESGTWPRQLESRLQGAVNPGDHVLVFNAGVNGYSGGHYLELLKRLGPLLRPQLVIVGYNINDFPNVVAAVDKVVFQGTKSLRAQVPQGVRDTLGRLALFRWMRATYYELNRERDWATAERLAHNVGKSTPGKEARFEAERKRLAGIVEESARLGAQLMIFLIPYESQVYLDIFDTAPIDRLRAVCGELNVAFVDLVEPFRACARETVPPRRLFLRGDRYHPTAEGYRLVADGLLQAIRSQGWLSGTH